MGLLTGKLEKDMELMRQQLYVPTSADTQKREKIVEQAVRSANLPSEVQKSMSQIISQRLKSQPANPQDQEEEDIRRRLVQQSADLVNMGSTLQRQATDSGGVMTKGKSLG